MNYKLQNFDKSTDHILFFTPEAKVVPHYVAQCMLACTLRDLGYKVLMVLCPGVFRRCPSMDMVSHPFDADEATTRTLCRDCIDIADTLTRHYGLPSVNIAQVIAPELVKSIREFVLAANNLQSLEYEGLRVGGLATRDLVYMTKRSDFANVDEVTKEQWRSYIETILLSYFAMQRLAAELPIKRLVYFNEYAVSNGAILAAQKLGIPMTAVTLASHNGINRQRYVLIDEPIFVTFGRLHDYWDSWQHVPMPKSAISEMTDDIITRMAAKSAHTYSPPKSFEVASNLFEKLSLDPHKTTLAAFTSSLDEVRALDLGYEAFNLKRPSSRQPFETQIEWLKALTDFVEASSDRQLVIRIHPREAANKRDSLVSQHLSQLTEALDKPFNNCRIVWPQDAIASYDLMEIADVALTSWSTIGLEMARVGIPVVTSFRNVTFPPTDFLRFGGETPEEYFATVVAEASQPITETRLTGAIALARLAGYLAFSLDMSDVIPTPSFDGIPEFVMPKEASTIESVVIEGTKMVEVNARQLRQEASVQGYQEISMHLHAQLRRLVHFFMTGQDRDSDFPLRFVRTSAEVSSDNLALLVDKHSSQSSSALIVISGRVCHYVPERGRVFSKISPMLVRLGHYLEKTPTEI